MPATNNRERSIADSQFGGGVTTWAPGTWYLGLSTTQPNDDGTGFTEPVAGAYARKSVLNDATQFDPAITTNGITTKQNKAAITFANPTGNWGLITHYGWFTASSGGQPEYWNPLDAAITVQSGNTPVEFAAGNLIMSWGQ